MKTAYAIFKELGYDICEEYEDTFLNYGESYEDTEGKGVYRRIHFDKRKKFQSIGIKAELNFKDIPKLFEAINQQCYELGWVEKPAKQIFKEICIGKKVKPEKIKYSFEDVDTALEECIKFYYALEHQDKKLPKSTLEVLKMSFILRGKLKNQKKLKRRKKCLN